MTNKEAFDIFYKSVEKRAEEFTIVTNKDTTILCKEGSIIFIPANCFETEKGETVKGPVQISVKEFYSISDIIGNKLTTLSNDRMLETGGMLHISAKTSSQTVRLKQGSSLDLKMPTRIFDPAMKLFMGEQVSDSFASTNLEMEERDSMSNYWMTRSTVNWIDRGQQQMFIKEELKRITLLNMRNNPVGTSSYKRNTKTKGSFVIPYNSPMSTSEVKRQLEEKYGKYYDKVVVRRQSKGLFRSAKKEKAEGIPQHEWYETIYVADSISIPILYAVRLRYITKEDSLAYENKWREELIAKQKRKAAYKEYLEFRQSYNFKIENLGWINCDQFIDYPSSRLTEFVVNVGEGFENSFFTSMLIFKKRAVALAGYYRDKKIHFNRIPVGEEVSIVSTVSKEGKMYASIISLATTRKQTIPELKFEPITPEDFKQKLSLFGSVTSSRN
ncbi:MAG TPA: hypothetical protein VF476_09540 [Chitinophagaceae bacterium]